MPISFFYALSFLTTFLSRRCFFSRYTVLCRRCRFVFRRRRCLFTCCLFWISTTFLSRRCFFPVALFSAGVAGLFLGAGFWSSTTTTFLSRRCLFVFLYLHCSLHAPAGAGVVTWVICAGVAAWDGGTSPMHLLWRGARSGKYCCQTLRWLLGRAGRSKRG